jgi:hypothetical protein
VSNVGQKTPQLQSDLRIAQRVMPRVLREATDDRLRPGMSGVIAKKPTTQPVNTLKARLGEITHFNLFICALGQAHFKQGACGSGYAGKNTGRLT